MFSVNTDVIIAQLAADPQWQVALDPQSGELRALERRLERDRWVVDSGNGGSLGFCTTELRFGASASNAPAYSTGETKSITLEQIANLYLSDAVVGTPGCWILVAEQHTAPDRNRTQQELQNAVDQLNAICKNAAEIRTHGACFSLLSGRTLVNTNPQLHVTSESHPKLSCWGWVNPGEPGITTIQLFEINTGAQLLPDKHSFSKERIGWSSDPAQLFYFCSDLVVPQLKTGFHTNHRIRVELWFAPDGAGESRQLLVAEQIVSGWEH